MAVLGAAGRMGRLVVAGVLDAPDLALAAAFGRPGSASLGTDAGTLAGRSPSRVTIAPVAACDADVWVDFSLPGGLSAALDHLGDAALVTGTTGLDDALAGRLRAEARRRAVLAAANFSTGVTLLRALVATAARALPDAAIEIVEAHHRHKRDAPSGTALALATAAADARGLGPDALRHGRSGATGPRPADEIGMHALRGGDVAGDHTVWLAHDGEVVTLGHRATARSTFAAGALRAARWIRGRPPGAYAMADVLGLSAGG